MKVDTPKWRANITHLYMCTLASSRGQRLIANSGGKNPGYSRVGVILIEYPGARCEMTLRVLVALFECFWSLMLQ